MTSSEATVAVEFAAGRPPAGEPASSLVGLIGVLDRADAPPSRVRPRPVHTAAFRAAGRQTPLRSVQPAPPARAGRMPIASAPRTPRVTIVPEPGRLPITGLRDLVRRLALWGSGANGEYLAWRSPAPEPRRSRRAAVRGLVRRAALWGAGERGEYLAWGAPAPVAAPRPLDPPVVLHELPSTPTIRPAATSPAAAPVPAPAARPSRTGPGVARATAPGARRGPRSPVGPGWAPPPPGWPQPPAWLVPPHARVAARTRPVHLASAGPAGNSPVARSPSASTRARPDGARGDPLPAPWPPHPRRARATPG